MEVIFTYIYLSFSIVVVTTQKYTRQDTYFIQIPLDPPPSPYECHLKDRTSDVLIQNSAFLHVRS